MSIFHRQHSELFNAFILGVFLLVATLVSSLVLPSNTSFAAPGKINYQGRLTDATGAAKPDGQYNMKFRIYDAASGGALIWSEIRETTNRVTVANGQFNVQLGGVTPIPSSAFVSDTRYFEVELPTPATATCSTAACGVYSEGPMTPRQPVASSAYALKAEDATTVAGYGAGALAKLGEVNSYSAVNQFYAKTDFFGQVAAKLDNAAALNVSSSGNKSLFNVDTVNTKVSLGYGAGGAFFGNKSIGAAGDTYNQESVSLSEYQTGPVAGPVAQISVYATGAEAAPNNKYKLAIYTGGSTGVLVAQSAEGTLVPGWNSIPISATLNPNSSYMLGYITNAVGGGNGIAYDGSGGISYIQTGSYASGFPSSLDGSGFVETRNYSMNVDFFGSASALSTNSFGRVGINTDSPAAALDARGDVQFRNVVNTNSAFRVQDAAAGTIFSVDTSGKNVEVGSALVGASLSVKGNGIYKNSTNNINAFRVQNSSTSSLFAVDTLNNQVLVGGSTPDATGVILVLDNKNTAGDPTFVAGGMYYNSNMGKFRCAEDPNTWQNCTPSRVYTVANNISSSSPLMSNITGLSFSTKANVGYNFKAIINYDTTNAGTGLKLSVFSAGSIRSFGAVTRAPLTASTEWIQYINAFDGGVFSANSALTTGNTATIEGMIATTTDSSVQMRYAMESGGTAITVKAGSSLMVW